jgi:major vault protein
MKYIIFSLAGDQYLFIGPATYYPRIEEKVLG